MFLTPAGEPFWGGTYFPKEAKYGRSSFVSVLKTVAEPFAAIPDGSRKTPKSLPGTFKTAPSGGDGGLSLAHLDDLAPKIVRSSTRCGGLNGARNFRIRPFSNCSGGRREAGREPYRDLVKLTLTQMSEAASTIISAAAMRAIRRTCNGSCRILRKCSMTMRRSSKFWRSAIMTMAVRFFARAQARRLAG